MPEHRASELCGYDAEDEPEDDNDPFSFVFELGEMGARQEAFERRGEDEGSGVDEDYYVASMRLLRSRRRKPVPIQFAPRDTDAVSNNSYNSSNNPELYDRTLSHDDGETQEPQKIFPASQFEQFDHQQSVKNSPSGVFIRSEWEIPKLIEQLDQPLASGDDLASFLSTFVVITGDENAMECTTCAEFLAKEWGHVGQLALSIIAVALGEVLDIQKNAENYGYSTTNSTTNEILACSEERTRPNDRELTEAIVWICSAMRSLPSLHQGPEKGLFRSDITRIPNPAASGPGKFSYKLKPLKTWAPGTSSTSTCWTKLFRCGIIASKRLDRTWGKGLEISYPMMIQLATVENYHMLDDGILLLGYRTALIPIDRNLGTNSLQWHFETMDESSEGLIQVRNLESTRKDWIKFKNTSEFDHYTCFVGWFTEAHVLLGTREIFQGSSRMMWSGAEECQRSLHPTGYEAGGQLSFSAGPINFAPQAVKTWGFVSNVQRFDPGQQYKQTLRSTRRSVALVIDSNTKQAWLVPTLSLILHLCHVWFQDTHQDEMVEDPIPFCRPGADGFSAALSAIENSGEIIVLGSKGDPNAETLRQLILRIYTNLAETGRTREDPRRGFIFATELMDIIEPSMKGSPLKKVDGFVRDLGV
ncbi:hypothetical protein CGCTS75_v008193 [Colletotrichum tropicale]|nr:hypothetical protein CGCTS75_v008193 [Colletotrichum tropicale]